jgi:hypothetical protein
MTIVRGPEPRENFQILPNATARDQRLSFRARGLLVLMLSYPPNWQFNRDWLARQTDGEGVSAVRTALQELETCGYLVRRRIQLRSDGARWKEGVYAVDAFYDAYRKSRKHRWPGRRLRKIYDDGGLEDWLIDEGLERM